MNAISFSLSQRTLLNPQHIHRANGTISERKTIMLCASDGTHQGFGEACPLPSFAGETYEACLSALQSLDSLPADYLDELPLSINQFISDDNPCAQFALECSLLDIVAQQKSTSIAKIINKHAAEGVYVQTLIDSSASHIPSSHTFIKCKVGQLPIEQEIKRIKGICQNINTNTQLRLDANGAWSKDQARLFINSVQDCPIAYIEDPCEKLEDIAWCIEEAFIPIAIDQALNQLHTRDQALQLSPAVWIIKPMCLGHIKHIQQVIEQIQEQPAAYIFSDFHNGNIARCYSRHIAAAYDINMQTHHGLAGNHLFENDFGYMAPLHDDDSYSPLENPSAFIHHV